jgi:AraC-like DNA-binding protein
MLSGSAVMDYYKLVCNKFGKIFSLFENSYSISVLRQIYALAQNKGIREVTLSQELSFSFICRLSEGISNYSFRYSPLTINAIQIIESEFSSLRGLAEISERMGVSQEHLSRTFSRETGYALIERLTRKRLSHAVSLLKDKRKTIDQIAGECGFSCGNYFSKAFKGMFGISPKSYRNMEQHSIYSNVIELN